MCVYVYMFVCEKRISFALESTEYLLLYLFVHVYALERAFKVDPLYPKANGRENFIWFYYI